MYSELTFGDRVFVFFFFSRKVKITTLFIFSYLSSGTRVGLLVNHKLPSMNSTEL